MGGEAVKYIVGPRRYLDQGGTLTKEEPLNFIVEYIISETSYSAIKLWLKSAVKKFVFVLIVSEGQRVSELIVSNQ